MIAVFKHELRNYFNSLTAYIFIGFLLLFVGIGSLLYNVNSALANFEYVLRYICIGMTVFIPILTMKILTEEKKQKTDQLLYSLPLSGTSVILGKYLTLVIVFAIPCLIMCFYPLLFSQYGDVYLPTSYGSLFAFFVLGCALIAIGMFVSSITDNMGFAAGISIPLLLFNYYSVSLAEYVSTSAVGSLIVLAVLIFIISMIIEKVTKNENLSTIVTIVLALGVGAAYLLDYDLFEGLLPNIMTSLSLFERFYTFVNGVFDLRAIVFYLTVIVFFLFLSVQSFEKRRYN